MLPWIWGCRYLLKSVFSLLLDAYPEMVLLDCVVVLFLIFWDSSLVFSMAAAPIYILTTGHKGFLCSTSLPALVILACLTTATLTGVRCWLAEGLICISLMYSIFSLPVCWKTYRKHPYIFFFFSALNFIYSHHHLPSTPMYVTISETWFFPLPFPFFFSYIFFGKHLFRFLA